MPGCFELCVSKPKVVARSFQTPLNPNGFSLGYCKNAAPGHVFFRSRANDGGQGGVNGQGRGKGGREEGDLAGPFD
jgi:hypothetical protein